MLNALQSVSKHAFELIRNRKIKSKLKERHVTDANCHNRGISILLQVLY